jgi:hypothetical protein
MAFCSNCGTKVDEGVKFCSNCGASIGVGQTATPPPNYSYQQGYGTALPNQLRIQQLSSKVHTSGVIWIIVGCLQLVLGVAIFWYWDNTYWFVPLVGILNIVAASRDFAYSKTVLINPHGIVKKYKPLVGLIVMLIYNLIFGGFIGVAAIIYDFTVRSFVLNNSVQFEQMQQAINN